jgi:hypothetical protein
VEFQRQRGIGAGHRTYGRWRRPNQIWAAFLDMPTKHWLESLVSQCNGWDVRSHTARQPMTGAKSETLPNVKLPPLADRDSRWAVDTDTADGEILKQFALPLTRYRATTVDNDLYILDPQVHGIAEQGTVASSVHEPSAGCARHDRECVQALDISPGSRRCPLPLHSLLCCFCFWWFSQCRDTLYP